MAVGLQYENEQLHHLLFQLTGTKLREGVNIDPSQAEQDVVPNNQFVKEEKGVKKETDSDSSKKGKIKARGKKKNKAQNPVQEELEPSDDGELEAYLRFASETERHRRERDSHQVNGDQKNSDDMDSDEEHKVNESNITVDYERLKEEMSELYGTDALKIHCQETRTELAFTEWRDKHRPVTWPAMPLNMSLRN